MEEIFIQLAIILLTAFFVSYIIRIFNQPIIIGYIVAGIIISPFILEFGASSEIIEIFSKFGIAFLLFIVGLHLNPKIIKEIGGSSLAIGLVQVLVTFGLGFIVALKLLGFNFVSSAYVGIALAFSSTIIVTKLLSDKKQIDSLYGKISIGILIIQDLIAIGVLIFISSLSGDMNFAHFATRTLITGLGALVVLGLFGFFVIPLLMKSVAKSQELLFLFSICWCFFVAGLFSYLGFSIEIGALLAGVGLSVSPYSTEISSKIRPLRDFFLIIFFIILGFNFPIADTVSILRDALVLSAVVLICKPIIFMTLMAFSGYTKRNNFLVGTTLAQISEFSLIVVTLGLTVQGGLIDSRLLPTITLTGIITIGLSTYLVIYSRAIYRKLSSVISIFERKNPRYKREIRKHYDAILFGYNRIGFGILRSLRKIKKKYLVVDFNPDTIATLRKFRIPCLYGDAFDMDLLEDLPLDKLNLVVSTIPDIETNLLLIESVRVLNKKAIIIVRAHQIKDALELYRKGASYVLTPHFLGGEYISKMIREFKINDGQYYGEKKKHIRMLEEMMKKGHEHPEV